MTESTLEETFNIAIAEELMRKVNPNVTEDDIKCVWSNCGVILGMLVFYTR